MTTDVLSLTPEHRSFLNAQAVTDAVAAEFGTRSVTAAQAAELGFAPHYVNGSGGIVFSWPVPGREPVLQFRPDDPVTPQDKYVFQAGCGSFVAVFRQPENGLPWLFVEGTKQSLAAVSWAPAGWGVAGTGGCDMWRGESLVWARDADVVVAFDKDLTTNPRVWDAAQELAGSLELEDAASVVFAVAKGAGAKDGLDDILARRPEASRTHYLEKLAQLAQPKTGRRPREKAREQENSLPDLGGRVGVAVNLDRKAVIDTILGAIKGKWDGTTLFDFGGALTQLSGTSTEPIESGAFFALLVQAVAAFRYTEGTGSRAAQYEPAWPDSQTISAVLSCAKQFTGLDRVMRAPFVRRDGTVCSEPGYDAASRTALVLADGLDVRVPQDPTPDDVSAARKLLMEDWLGDFPFPSDADRANALAMMITPFVRDRIDLAPMAVVDGLQMGVGKNLLADCLSILVYGTAAAPRPLSSENEEVRKTVTAALRRGEALVIFDEAHVIEGRSLAQVLTAETWSDRVLGVSEDVHLPNTATWVALGNQVTVNADCVRRVYWIRLAPPYANPQDRPAESFRHPDLKEWTTDNRSQLLTAVLTLVRAWYVQGCLYTPRGESFGSFTRWEKTVGGILQSAGVTGFLEGLRAKRGDSDFVGSVWVEHLSWLVQVFGAGAFSCAQVKSAALSDGAGFLAPPGLEDTSDKGWSRSLGNAYRSAVGVNKNGMTLYKTGQGHNNVAQYMVSVDTPTNTDSVGGTGGSGGTSYPYASRKHYSVVDHDTSPLDIACVGSKAISGPPGPPGPPVDISDPFAGPFTVPDPVPETPGQPPNGAVHGPPDPVPVPLAQLPNPFTGAGDVSPRVPPPAVTPSDGGYDDFDWSL